MTFPDYVNFSHPPLSLSPFKSPSSSGPFSSNFSPGFFFFLPPQNSERIPFAKVLLCHLHLLFPAVQLTFSGTPLSCSPLNPTILRLIQSFKHHNLFPSMNIRIVPVGPLNPGFAHLVHPKTGFIFFYYSNVS